MSLIIQHNLAAMNSSRMLGLTSGRQVKSTEKLSSGYRINRAADDAAGLSISEKMRKLSRGLDRGSDNAMDGGSMVQIADGAMNEIHEMLQRGNVLAVQAANGTNSDSDRAAIQNEMNQLCDEIDRISDRTKFNETYVLKGKTVEIPIPHEQPAPVTPGKAKIEKTPLPDWVKIDDKSLALGGLAQSIDNHASALIDFSGLTASNVSDLNGKGIYTTCCSCNAHYTIKFVAGNQNGKEQSGEHFIYSVGTDGVTSGSDLIDRIMQATNDGTAGLPNNHLTQFTHAKDDQNTLWIYDTPGNRTANPQNDRGVLGQGIATEDPSVIPDPTYTYTYETYHVAGNASIHAGAEADMENKIVIRLPDISCEKLGITPTPIDISTESKATEAITKFGGAIAKVSEDRSRMGGLSEPSGEHHPEPGQCDGKYDGCRIPFAGYGYCEGNGFLQQRPDPFPGWPIHAGSGKSVHPGRSFPPRLISSGSRQNFKKHVVHQRRGREGPASFSVRPGLLGLVFVSQPSSSG